MNVPIILLCGAAGSGKDAAAQILWKRCGAVTVAQADPMKRFVNTLFGFPSKNLWGPSGDRELPVPVYPLATEQAKEVLFDLLREIDFKGDFMDTVRPFEAWYNGQRMQAARQDGRLAARGCLQTLGTEFGRRTLGEETWASYSLRIARKLLRGGHAYHRSHGLAAKAGQPQPPAPMVVITDGRFINEIVGAREAGAVPVLVTGRRSEGVGNAQHQSEQEMKLIPEHFFASVLHNTGSLEDLEAALEDLVTYHFLTIQHGDSHVAGGVESCSLWREAA